MASEYSRPVDLAREPAYTEVVADPLPLPPLPRLPRDAHKGDRGAVLVVAGSRAYPGAAILTALGAGRGGAGYVRLAIPESIVPWVLPAVPFAVLEPCPDARGALGGDAIAPVLAAAERSDAVVLGPGLGTHEATGSLLAAVIAEVEAPLLLDADGLNLLAAAAERRGGGRVDGVAAELEARPGPTVLTPHPGEFARLTGEDVPAARARRDATIEAAARFAATVVLKGAGTVVSDGRRVRVETAGNPGLATGGSGDVLAGLAGALLARGDLGDATQATALAVHLHASAADLAASELGEEPLLPTDVADAIGAAIDTYRSGPTSPDPARLH